MLETDRFYRNWHNGRFESFTVAYKETDLWIGVDVFHERMINFTYDIVIKLRKEIEDCILKDPIFLTSFEPLQIDTQSKVVQQMVNASRSASVGPMAAVAGAIADEVGRFLIEEFNCGEVVVENGGDIFIKNIQPIDVAIYAGNSVLSGKIGLEIPPGKHGVCTSSGTVGHSFSFGKADAVTIVSDSASFADAFATSYCNMVKNEEDIEKVLKIALNEHVQTVVIIYRDKLGAVGKHGLVLISQGEGD
ncbi:MAG TPA: UPF0280 family protein [Fervidobacterium sp.]|nr:UPF0280 family protein [Fervidobacterium sp.]HOM74454.1 UPF0280 family protein [Fervidobacterium sp.]HOQ40019.1 UPF0280 family protein [Fervidobacterium sp.]HPP17303.1 UPF0280 family protein [Fervidobacterium sp.]HPT54505.1 UPF0280 family protein [Fervidobacterium sp.]